MLNRPSGAGAPRVPAVRAAQVAHLPSAGWLRSTTIRVRLIIAFSALLALLLATAGIGAWQLIELNRVAAQNLRIERLIGEWQSEMKADSVRTAVLARSDDAGVRQLLVPQSQAAGLLITQLQLDLQEVAAAAAAKPLLADIAAKGKLYLDVRQQVLDRGNADQRRGAIVPPDTAVQPATQAFLEASKALSTLHASAAGNGSASAQRATDTGLRILVAACLVGALIQFLACWLVTASIVRPIRVAAKVARKVAAGDLTVNIRLDGRDEGTVLLQALSDMLDNLRTLVGEVVHGAHTVSDTSAQLASGNLDLSQRTEQQAGTLEQTSGSLHGLTAMVVQNAESARKACHLAIGASEVARRGGEAVGEVVSTMTAIANASKRITDIIGVIDGIAFQTNILALNAAVEAARAGEQGRGFAVVAAEVRSLAQRSTAAAKEIKTLIGDSVGQVEAGTRLVDAAGRTMDEIVDAVEKVTDLIGEIAASSQEQSSGIRKVHTAVTQMDEVVQQNASLVEEASAATASMNEQAGTLLRLVSRFKLEAVPTAPVTPPQAAARVAAARIGVLRPAHHVAARVAGSLAVR